MEWGWVLPPPLQERREAKAKLPILEVLLLEVKCGLCVRWGVLKLFLTNFLLV